MNVYVITEASLKGGFGHVSRCVALCEAFRERNIKRKLYIHVDVHAKNILHGLRYNNYIDHDRLLKNDLTKVSPSDVLVVDSYRLPRTFYAALCRLFKKTLFFDDYNRLIYPYGLLVNAAIDISSKEYEKQEECCCLLGPKYTVLRKPFWSNCRYRVRKHVRHVVVCCSSARGSFLRTLVHELKNGANIRITIVNGMPESMADIAQLPQVQALNNISAKQMKRVMLSSDVAICGGGQTLLELTRVGVPNISVCFADNQMANIKGCQKKELTIYAGKAEKKTTIQNIIMGVNAMSFSKRVAMNKKALLVIDGNGARRIVNYMLS